MRVRVCFKVLHYWFLHIIQSPLVILFELAINGMSLHNVPFSFLKCVIQKNLCNKCKRDVFLRCLIVVLCCHGWMWKDEKNGLWAIFFSNIVIEHYWSTSNLVGYENTVEWFSKNLELSFVCGLGSCYFVMRWW